MKWRLSFFLLAGLCTLTFCLPHQYHFVANPLTWTEARSYCREQYTDLATVDNIEEMNRLVNTVKDSTSGFTEKAWIGLYDNGTDWKWSHSDEGYYGKGEADYRNWGYKLHNVGTRRCVRMQSGGKWDDTQCKRKSAFVCYDGRHGTNVPFKYVVPVMTWSGAQKYCRKHYTDLASVRNRQENDWIERLIRNRSYLVLLRTVWIGLRSNREWSDLSTSTYRYWENKHDAVRGLELCIASNLWNAGKWTDEKCSRELAFVCYGEEKETTTATTPTFSTTDATFSITNATFSTTDATFSTTNATFSTTDATISTTNAATTTMANKIATSEVDSTTVHQSTEMAPAEQPRVPVMKQPNPAPAYVIELTVIFTPGKYLTHVNRMMLVYKVNELLAKLNLSGRIKLEIKRVAG